MIELIDKIKSLYKQCEDSFKKAKEDEAASAKLKAECEAQSKKLDEREKSVADREQKISFSEDLQKYKDSLDKRDADLKEREKNIGNAYAERERHIGKMEEAAKEKDKHLSNVQADLVLQREAVEKDKKEFRTKIIEELDKQYEKKRLEQL